MTDPAIITADSLVEIEPAGEELSDEAITALAMLLIEASESITNPTAAAT